MSEDPLNRAALTEAISNALSVGVDESLVQQADLKLQQATKEAKRAQKATEQLRSLSTHAASTVDLDALRDALTNVPAGVDRALVRLVATLQQEAIKSQQKPKQKVKEPGGSGSKAKSTSEPEVSQPVAAAIVVLGTEPSLTLTLTPNAVLCTGCAFQEEAQTI